MTSFVIDGEPISKARPRVTSKGTYTPLKTLLAEQAVGWLYRQAGGRGPDPVKHYGIWVTFYCGNKRRRDLDNMVKLILDGLNRVAWADDDQVTEILARKVFSPGHARTEVRIYGADICQAGEPEEVPDGSVPAAGSAGRTKVDRRGHGPAHGDMLAVLAEGPAEVPDRPGAAGPPRSGRQADRAAEGASRRPAGTRPAR